MVGVVVTRTLWWLSVATGVVCVAIGVLHLTLGVGSVPGEGGAGATVDSRERFYGAVFAGYGVAWVWAARAAVPSAVLWLSGILFLGGLGRLVSLAVEGRPQWFQLVLTGIELVLPWVMVGLVVATRNAVGSVGARDRSAITR